MRALTTHTRSKLMILKLIDNMNGKVSKPLRDKQLISAKYDPNKQTTTVCFDADIVTLGIVATFLMTEFLKKRDSLPDDITGELDTAISKTLRGLDVERGQAI